MKTKVSVFWFRRDLRLEDNAGLYQALSSGYPVFPVFIFDIAILNELESKYDCRKGIFLKAMANNTSFKPLQDSINHTSRNRV